MSAEALRLVLTLAVGTVGQGPTTGQINAHTLELLSPDHPNSHTEKAPPDPFQIMEKEMAGLDLSEDEQAELWAYFNPDEGVDVDSTGILTSNAPDTTTSVSGTIAAAQQDCPVSEQELRATFDGYVQDGLAENTVSAYEAFAYYNNCRGGDNTFLQEQQQAAPTAIPQSEQPSEPQPPGSQSTTTDQEPLGRGGYEGQDRFPSRDFINGIGVGGGAAIAATLIMTGTAALYLSRRGGGNGSVNQETPGPNQLPSNGQPQTDDQESSSDPTPDRVTTTVVFRGRTQTGHRNVGERKWHT